MRVILSPTLQNRGASQHGLGAPHRASALFVAGAALGVALAAWLSQGTLAFATPVGPRIGLLPLSITALSVSFAAAIVAGTLVYVGVSATPLWLLLLLWLPWLPAEVPSAFLAWSGAPGLMVWAVVAFLLAREAFEVSARVAPMQRWGHAAGLLRLKPRLSSGLLSALIFAGAAWQTAPSVPSGDEPHYLIITQSLLRDRDLRIENNHRRGDYQEYLPGTLAPHYLRRGRDGQIYSIHAPGISALVAPAYALGGYHGVTVFLILLAASGSALGWHVAWLVTRDVPSAWFGWAAVTLSSTTIFHSFTVYPDGTGGVLVLTGIWALLRIEQELATRATRVRPWFLHGAALAMLPWLHTRFAVLAGSLGALILLRLGTTKNSAAKAAVFLTMPAISALGWMGYFIAIYGAADPSAPYGSSREFSLSYVRGGLFGLFFDQRFGLFATAPGLMFAIAGLVTMVTQSRRNHRADRSASSPVLSPRRLAFELLFVIVPYLLTVTSFAMWWGGWSAPARFAAAIVPMLVLPCAFVWRALETRATRVTACGAIFVSAFISAVLIVPQDGRLAFNTRESYALWLDWSSKLADLGQGTPAWFRGRETAFIADVAIWLAACFVAWSLLRVAQRWLRTRNAIVAVAALAYSLSGMAALSLLWARHGVEGTAAAPAQLDFLRRLSTEPRLVALQLVPPRLLDGAAVTKTMQIEPGMRFAADGGGRSDRPLLTLMAVPAGQYRIRPRVRGPGGWLMVGIGQDQFALRTEPITSPPVPLVVYFPVDVRAIVVRGDEDARRTVRTIVVEPISIVPANLRLTDDDARRAVRYGNTTLLFLDERSFPEPEAFWVEGSRSTGVVFHPDEARSTLDLFLRNAPVENRLTIQAGAWREEWPLAPGEERRVRIPLDPARGATLVRFAASSGFRPSAVDSTSRDDRFLGVWIRAE
jgi:hypothetical protein